MPAAVYTFETLGPAIRKYALAATKAARDVGLVPELGARIADTVRVKSGWNAASTVSTRSGGLDILQLGSAKAIVADAGRPPGNYETDYPPRYYPPPSRRSFADPVRAATPLEPVALVQGAPHSAPREALDGAVQKSITVERRLWKNTGERAAKVGLR